MQSEKMKLKAGPPRCQVCGAVMEAWTKMFPDKIIGGPRSLLWLCPNRCDFK